MKPRVIIPIVILLLIVVVIVIDAKRRDAADELKQLSVKMEQMQGGNTAENQKRANEIIQKVQRHMTIDTSVTPTVATIVDVEKLKEQNSFYNKAKNGDFLVVTPTRAILYDAGKDRIIDVAPVQIDDRPAAASTSSKAG